MLLEKEKMLRGKVETGSRWREELQMITKKVFWCILWTMKSGQ